MTKTKRVATTAPFPQPLSNQDVLKQPVASKVVAEPGAHRPLAKRPIPTSSPIVPPRELAGAPPPQTEPPEHGLPQKPVFDIDEVMTLLGVSRQSIYRLTNTGQLRVCKLLGRSVVRRIDLMTLLDSLAQRHPHEGSRFVT